MPKSVVLECSTKQVLVNNKQRLLGFVKYGYSVGSPFGINLILLAGLAEKSFNHFHCIKPLHSGYFYIPKSVVLASFAKQAGAAY
jgi:hypothetical protein